VVPNRASTAGPKTAIPFVSDSSLRETVSVLKSFHTRVLSFWPDTIGPKPFDVPLCGGRLKTGHHTVLLRIQFDEQLFFDRRVGLSSSCVRGHDLGLELLRSLLDHGSQFWLCATFARSSTMAFWCIYVLVATVSPTLTLNNDGC